MLFSNYLFWSAHCPRFVQWDPFQAGTLSCVLLTCLLLFFEHIFTFWHKMFQTLLVLSLTQHWNQSSFKEPWFLLVENGFFNSKIWVPAALISIGVSMSIALSADRANKTGMWKNMCVHVCICVIHIPLNTCIYTRSGLCLQCRWFLFYTMKRALD